MLTRARRCSVRLYRRLLWLYPRAHRETYGALMADLFAEMVDDAAAAGGVWPFVRLWRLALLDLLVSAAREHADGTRKRPMTFTFWLFWLLGSIVGWLVGWAVGYPFTTPVLVPLGGALVAVLHVALLQRTLAPPGWWRRALPLAAGGWLLVVALLALHPWTALDEGQMEIAFIFTLFGGAILVGGLQALALRSLTRRAWLWVPVPAFSLLLAGAAGLALNAAAVPLVNEFLYGRRLVVVSRLVAAGATPDPMLVFVLIHVLTGALIAVFYGLFSGAALRLLRPQTPSTLASAP